MPDDPDSLRQAWEARSHDLVEAQLGLVQAVAALTEELDLRRREAHEAQLEAAAVREHAAREAGALREQVDLGHAAVAELKDQL
ncbi:MAG: hypothetical protein H0W96_13520, partial [Solirubrobacterales bacterium]|nr:hypothetical protein [Solirubrobacterales bacterium]